MADADTPEILFERYQGYIAKELSKGFTHEQVEDWLTQVCDTLGKGRSMSFRVRFAQLLRASISEVITKTSNTQINNSKVTFDPQVWKTVKIHRDDWTSTCKAIRRADKQRNNAIRIIEVD
jgi:hypothetical protein